MTDTLQLQEALATGGIRAVSFFNGRLLTGRDMSRVDEARREGDKRLGSAIGDGVAHGFELAGAGLVDGVPVVTVSPGLAVNRLGQVLRLAENERVALARPFGAEAGAGGFGYCVPQVSGAYEAGAGAYLLTIAAATRREGSAQVSGTDPGNVRCNADAEVEAVQFRLLMVPTSLTEGLSSTSPDYRNALAYRCFGPRAHADLGVNPLLAAAAPPAESLLDSMARYGLSPADVPLALLSFRRANELRFIDSWAVRRPLAPAEEALPGLATLGGARRTALGRAMLRQFAAHMAEVTPGSLRARTHFRFLPAAGLLPLAPGEDGTAFFQGLTTRGPLHINAAELESLLRDGLTRPPMVTDPPAPEKDRAMVWLYRVAEHAIAVDAGATPRPYLAFASGHIPPRADARFDLFRFDYANVALVP
jgi:hypothetical protein